MLVTVCANCLHINFHTRTICICTTQTHYHTAVFATTCLAIGQYNKHFSLKFPVTPISILDNVVILACIYFAVSRGVAEEVPLATAASSSQFIRSCENINSSQFDYEMAIHTSRQEEDTPLDSTV
jgi:hypothetical protein